jgi:hypothetical protein
VPAATPSLEVAPAIPQQDADNRNPF